MKVPQSIQRMRRFRIVALLAVGAVIMSVSYPVVRNAIRGA